jgi:CoA:oxalate CoA-transferase
VISFLSRLGDVDGGNMKKALQGVRILDFTRVLSGPFCTAMLADLGAEVIKVEGPGEAGDVLRSEGWGLIGGEPISFMAINRGKKGITINLKKQKGKDIIKKLVGISDVVIENFRPGVMERFGLSYDTLKEINPKIIYVSINGFGRGSPYETLPSYDIVAQAMGGLMSVTGEEDGPPTRVGSNVGDTYGALYSAFSICVALLAREKYGVGQQIEISMCDSIFSILDIPLYNYLATNKVPTRIGCTDPFVYPFDRYSASDGFFVLAAYDPRTFLRFCEAIERPDLLQDEEFASISARSRNRTKLKKIIEDWSARRTVEEVSQIMGKAGVPTAPVLNIGQIVESEHIKSREMLVEVEHPRAGKTRIPALPVKFSETPAKIEKPSPLLGQHNEEILIELLGYNKEEIERLREEEVICEEGSYLVANK